LSSTVANTSQGVGCSKTKIVVTVSGESSLK
jgi:hypothetical protein